MPQIKDWLFSLTRTPLAGRLLRKVFAHMSFAIPVQKLRETPSLMAFRHPRPSYPLHILLVPKREYRSLMEVPLDDSALHRDLFEVVQSLVRELGLESAGYRLTANGGPYQDTPILHFHLVSDWSPAKGER